MMLTRLTSAWQNNAGDPVWVDLGEIGTMFRRTSDGDEKWTELWMKFRETVRVQETPEAILATRDGQDSR